MRKIISLFQRNYEGDRLVRDEVVPGAEWVLAGEGRPTEKIDGTSCLVQDGKLFKRYDAKHGKTPPAGFLPAQPTPDPVTGHWPGWLPVDETRPEDRWHWQAWQGTVIGLPDGTYELVGPKVQGDPYQLLVHSLVPHGQSEIPGNPRTYEAIKAFLAAHRLEGIVWHHEDGRMVKIKARDFGLTWPR